MHLCACYVAVLYVSQPKKEGSVKTSLAYTWQSEIFKKIAISRLLIIAVVLILAHAHSKWRAKESRTQLALISDSNRRD